MNQRHRKLCIRLFFEGTQVKKTWEYPLSVVEIPEEEYNKVNGYYYNTRIQINKDRDEKSKKYPYDKSHATEDEISIAREEGDLRTKISKLKEMNQSLRKDCMANFNREITLD